MSADPLGHHASMSLYDYCANDPVNCLDPDGRFGKLVIALADHIPLIGGMLGGALEIGFGAIDTALGLATLGKSGTLSLGLNQIVSGASTEADIVARDAAATLAGIIGKVYVTSRDVANVLTFGQISVFATPKEGVAQPPSTFWGAIIGMFSDLPVPCYGMFAGSGWGVPNFGLQSGLRINQSDVASYIHDQLPGSDWQWLKNQYSTHPELQWVGPVGTGFVLLGTVPFAIVGAFQPHP